jgi:WD40 repeat protein
MTSIDVSAPSSNVTLAILSESEVVLWDLHPNREENNVRVFNPYPDEDDGVPISCLAWNHNQMVIATSSGIPTDEFEHDNIVLLSAQTGQQLDSFQHDERNQKQQHRHVAGAAANTINFGGKSRYLCIGDENGAICLWDLKKKTRVRQYFHTTNDPSPSLQVSLDPTDTYVMSLSSSAMYVYNLRDGLFMGTLKAPDDITNGNDDTLFTNYAISNLEPNKCAIGTNDGSIYMYDITNHSQSSPLFELTQRHNGAVTGLSFSAIDSNLLISCAQDGIVLAHNISEGTSYEVCALDDNSIIQSMSLHSNGVTCAVGCESGDIYIYDIRNSTEDVGITKTMLASYQINGPVNSLHFAPPPRVKNQRLATNNNPDDNVVSTNYNVKSQNTVELPMDATPAKFKSDISNDDNKNKTVTTQQKISTVSSLSTTAPKSYVGSPTRIARMAAKTRLASTDSKLPAVKPASVGTSNTLTGGSKKYQRSTIVVNKTKETTPLSPPTKRRPLDANKYGTVRSQQQENAQQTLNINNNVEGIREVVREEVENLQDEMEEQLRNLHIDMINQFHLQSQEIDTALSTHFIKIERLELENQQLREENVRLRQDRG